MYEIFFYLIITILVILLIFEDTNKLNFVVVAFFSGLMLDLFSLKPLGFYTLIFVFAALLIKIILRKYVWPIPQRF